MPTKERSYRHDLEPNSAFVLLIRRTPFTWFVPFDEHHAHAAISIKEQVGKANVSLAGRVCLGLASARGLPVVTADQLWAKLGLNVEVILIRGELH